MYLSQKEKVLLSFLGVIFVSQIYFLGVAFQYCKANEGLRSCADIGKRVEVTFAGMTATVLALITNIGTGRSTK